MSGSQWRRKKIHTPSCSDEEAAKPESRNSRRNDDERSRRKPQELVGQERKTQSRSGTLSRYSRAFDVEGSGHSDCARVSRRVPRHYTFFPDHMHYMFDRKKAGVPVPAQWFAN